MADGLEYLATKIPHVPIACRKVMAIAPEDFQTANDRREWASCDQFAGWTILNFDRSMLIRAPMGHCMAIAIEPEDPTRHFK